jgi:adenylate kinase family enzyme
MDGPRLLFLGTSGSGKTTAARAAAARLGLEHVELDAIRHGPNWLETPDDRFRAIVADIAARDAWVVDGNYAIVRDLLIRRATQVVWVDPPKRVVMAQVIWRSASRAVLRTELWNGNRERAWTWLRADHPIRWAWDTYDQRRRKFEHVMTEKWVRLRSRREVRRWLDNLPRRRHPGAERPSSMGQPAPAGRV